MMKMIASNFLEIIDPPNLVYQFISDNYEIDNPSYEKKRRLGVYVGNEPKKILMYAENEKSIRLPYGTIDTFSQFGDIENKNKATRIDGMQADIPLYDYQEEAVEYMSDNRCVGILQSPAGSGKTQMGLALAIKLGVKTLWITHTVDLLQQSYERARLYVDKSKLGKITAGKVNIGEWITFATVQTLVKVDPSVYEKEFDCVIVDECHRVAGTPTKYTQFSKVLNVIHSYYKFGLSATVHRSDGLIKTCFALLGNIAYTVPDEAVKDKIIKPTIKRVKLDTEPSDVYLDASGMMVYNDLIQYLVDDSARNFDIVLDLISNKNNHCLVLSDRIEHLNKLCEMLNISDKAVVINGKTKSEERQKAIEDMRNGKKNFLFATYSLAKEGLDIPILDRLFLTTPHSDYAVVVQSIGRISRTFEGKEKSIAYDYVDENIIFLKNNFKKRLTAYRRLGVKME